MAYNKKRRHTFEVTLNDDELAAVGAWREANAILTTQEALQDLVQIGLLSEIRHIYIKSTAHNHSIASKGATALDDDE